MLLLLLLACAPEPLGVASPKLDGAGGGWDTGLAYEDPGSAGEDPQLDPGSWGIVHRGSRLTTTVGMVAVSAVGTGAANRDFVELWAMCSPSRMGSSSTALRLQVVTDTYTEAAVEAAAASGCGASTQYAARMDVSYRPIADRSTDSSIATWAYGSSGYTAYVRDVKVSLDGGASAVVGHLVRLQYSSYRFVDAWYFAGGYPYPWSTDQAARQAQLDLGTATVSLSTSTIAGGPDAVLNRLATLYGDSAAHYAVVDYQFVATSNALSNTF